MSKAFTLIQDIVSCYFGKRDQDNSASGWTTEEFDSQQDQNMFSLKKIQICSEDHPDSYPRIASRWLSPQPRCEAPVAAYVFFLVSPSILFGVYNV